MSVGTWNASSSTSMLYGLLCNLPPWLSGLAISELQCSGEPGWLVRKGMGLPPTRAPRWYGKAWARRTPAQFGRAWVRLTPVSPTYRFRLSACNEINTRSPIMGHFWPMNSVQQLSVVHNVLQSVIAISVSLVFPIYYTVFTSTLLATLLHYQLLI